MDPRVLRVNESDAVRDLATLLKRVQAGAEVRRTISTCIALAEAHKRESGQSRSRPAADVEEIVPEPQAVEAALVGLILDSVVIAAERRVSAFGVTIVELTHGLQRAGTDERRQRRQASCIVP
ncbi:MAG: hypothetical protein LAP87_15150 [Acidobacteriia bacterium]|nr:hypothetical protein [Terriglobia bacterium]